jgi:hypothetical protein
VTALHVHAPISFDTTLMLWIHAANLRGRNDTQQNIKEKEHHNRHHQHECAMQSGTHSALTLSFIDIIITGI